MKLPDGFEVAAGRAGLKPSGKPDLTLIYSPYPLAWALCSTSNSLKAACVQRNRARHATGQTVRAVVVNSGNANCATGDRGIWDNEDFAGAAASALALPSVQEALTASTGVIGRPFPVDKVREALPRLVQQLGSDSAPFAEAIMTTDTRPKQLAVTLSNGSRIVGVCKGSGMIHPDMATMLAFVMTDANLPQEALRELWPGVVARSFNQVTVDGDTSPNDMAMLLASQRRAVNADEFATALSALCQKLAQMIARDGEGATKLITVKVIRARSDTEALAAAKAVAGSALVKSAVHGNDPNWGRILSSVGASGAVFDQAGVRIRLQGTEVYAAAPREFDAGALSRSLADPDVLIEVDLAAGRGNGTAWGCDLTSEYVRINAEYTT